MPIEDVRPISETKLNANTAPIIRGVQAFMNNQEYSYAKDSKVRYTPMAPDMRELTDESKIETRKFRAEERKKKREGK